ncbi:class I SAM-dependent methyltransferase [Egibacter rhizosphaerae]|uniref:Class I SAM-dependent methyltransferase n=1 Tax=Egibacter rhizosphaerae TaxID=1670831 RepID=A0A411YD42_9ACTN|nr:class I SAM-dependent methyltransferase [Egibacter rhizosphaerae]QBI19057.1 class I SAM-dependent methyltransferase [Egibacter rhizosphaerae]
MDIKTKQVVYHDWEADHYDEKWSISFDDRCISYVADRFRTAAPEPDGPYDAALEVGCGTGFFVLNLAQAGIVRRATVTDVSPEMVRACKTNGQRLGIEVDGGPADAEALPFDDASFDLVVGHAVVHHLPDVAAAFREFRRVLRPGGRLVIAGEPTLTGDRIAAQFKRVGRVGVKLAAVVAGAERVLADPAHVSTVEDARAAALEWEVDLHCFRPDELEAHARAAGFEDVRSETEELTANWLGWVARTVEGMVGAQRLGPRYAWTVYRAWQHLFAFDQRVAARVVPKAAFYNCLVTGIAGGERAG